MGLDTGPPLRMYLLSCSIKESCVAERKSRFPLIIHLSTFWRWSSWSYIVSLALAFLVQAKLLHQAAKMLAVLFNKNKLGEDTPHAVLNWRLWYGVFGKPMSKYLRWMNND